MSPQLKAQIAATLERQAQAMSSALTQAEKAKVLTQSVNDRIELFQPPIPIDPPAQGRRDGHKPGYMAAYMREWRAKQKAKA